MSLSTKTKSVFKSSKTLKKGENFMIYAPIHQWKVKTKEKTDKVFDHMNTFLCTTITEVNNTNTIIIKIYNNNYHTI